jgi:uncharacterized membrane protein YfcA
MNANNPSPEPGEPRQPASAVPMILTFVCMLSGLYACAQLARMFPFWLAVLLTVAVGCLLVVCLSAVIGNELLDVVIGCATVIVAMALVVPAGAEAFRKHHPPPVQSKRGKTSAWPGDSTKPTIVVSARLLRRSFRAKAETEQA